MEIAEGMMAAMQSGEDADSSRPSLRRRMSMLTPSLDSVSSWDSEDARDSNATKKTALKEATLAKLNELIDKFPKPENPPEVTLAVTQKPQKGGGKSWSSWFSS